MTIPNLLSIFRLILVPAFPIVFFSPAHTARYWAAVIYAVAFLTDILDGYIARRFHQITRLGRVLDPLADKLMTFVVIITITVAEIIPLWAVIVFFCKEALMALGAIYMYRKTHDIMPSNYLGKASTGVFFAVCAALVLLPMIPPAAAAWMIGIALALAVVALLVYLRQFFIFNREHALPAGARNAGKD